MSKRQNNEIEVESQPSTSRDALALENIKRSRLDFNFWDDNEVEQNIPVQSTELYIRDLRIGKILQNTLKIRITYVSHIRKSKLGDVVSFHGIDCISAEIAFVNFGQYCHNIINYLKINSIYAIKNFSVNEENSQYPSGSGNKLQIKLNSNVEIEELDDDSNFPNIFFKFIPLESVQNLNKNERIDVLGVLVKDYGLEKNYKGTSMRELVITDVSKYNLVITLWGVNAEKFSLELYSVIVIRKAVVNEYEGRKKLNCISGTLIWIDADISEAKTLKREFDELIKCKTPNT